MVLENLDLYFTNFVRFVKAKIAFTLIDDKPKRVLTSLELRIKKQDGDFPVLLSGVILLSLPVLSCEPR